MNVLGISGTPRKNGNSEILLQYALRPFEKQGWQKRVFRLSEITVQPCRGCEQCKKQGRCVIEDDMHPIYDAFRWCDALIISSPVYSRNISAQLLAVLDRHYAVRLERPLEGKAGGAMAVGGGTCGGQTITINAIYNWMLSRGIICVPGTERRHGGSVRTRRYSEASQSPKAGRDFGKQCLECGRETAFLDKLKPSFARRACPGGLSP